MKYETLIRTALLACTASTLLCVATIPPAAASPVSYTIDPNQSALAPVAPIIPTAASSIPVTGTIAADLAGAALTFSGGSAMIGDGALAGTASYSHTITSGLLAVTISGTASVVYSDLSFDLLSPFPLSSGSNIDQIFLAPLSGLMSGTSAPEITVFQQGTEIINVVNNIVFSADYSGLAAQRLESGNIQWSDDSATETLILDFVSALYDAPLIIEGIDFGNTAIETLVVEALAEAFDPFANVAFVTEMVATRSLQANAIPEPGSMALLGSAILAFGAIRRRVALRSSPAVAKK